MQIKQIQKKLEKHFPLALAEDWDNVGLLLGSGEWDCTGVLTALDVTPQVLDQALEKGCNLVVCHHPIIFKPVAAIGGDSLLYRAAAAHLSVLCLHTNLDIAKGGVNDCLAAALELQVQGPLLENGLGRLGDLPHTFTDAQSLATYVKQKLASNGVRFSPAVGAIKKVALCSGAGGDLLADAQKAGAQALICGEAKYNHFLEAREMGLALIAAGHFATEVVVAPTLADTIAPLGVPVYVAQEYDPEEMA